MWEQRVGLKHHVDRAFVRRYVVHVDAIDQYRARGRSFEAGEHTQQGGFAAARATEQAEQFTFKNFKIDVIDRGEVAEVLADALHLDERFGVRIEPGTVVIIYLL